MYITIGIDSISKRPYRIDPTRHINILGATGVGKTSLLERILLESVKLRFGAAVFDVHGDFADRTTLVLPSSIQRDFIWYNPSDDSVPVFNPLFFQDPDELELAIEAVLTLLKALSGSDSAWGNETPHNARAGLDAITELIPNPTLAHLYRFVLDGEWREGLIARSRNPFLKLWAKQFAKLSTKDQAAKMSPLANKLSKLMRPSILPTICGDKAIDPLDIMNNRRVLVCRLSKGRLGDETATVLYSFIVAMFSIAALRREKQKIRPPFIIIADEAQNGVHGGRFGTLLSEARKYGISLVTAFQASSQMPIMSDILTNAGTQVVFEASGDDAKLMAENWQSEKVIPKSITDLSRFEFWSRTFEHDQPIVRNIIGLPPLRARRKSNAHLLKLARQYWTTQKTETQAKIDKILTA